MLNYICFEFQKYGFYSDFFIHLLRNKILIAKCARIGHTCARDLKRLLPSDVTTSKCHFPFFLTNSKPFVNVFLNRYSFKQMKMSFILLLKILAINTMRTFELTLWRQRQLFWTREKSAIWRPTEGKFYSAVCNIFFKIQISGLLYIFRISNICTVFNISKNSLGVHLPYLTIINLLQVLAGLTNCSVTSNIHNSYS